MRFLLRAVALVWVIAFLATAPAGAAGRRYWIDESTDYTGNGVRTLISTTSPPA
ncbi:MAG: hypothetical protein IH936_09635 [Acidobacteria bacterium]|nr:hypothetical protein [Acidobacteriota bacterium]